MYERCAECGPKKDRKTEYICENCQKHVCMEHMAYICKKCTV